MISVLTQFLANRSQCIVVDACRSNLVNVALGMPQGSVLGQMVTLVAVVPSPLGRVLLQNL